MKSTIALHYVGHFEGDFPIKLLLFMKIIANLEYSKSYGLNPALRKVDFQNISFTLPKMLIGKNITRWILWLSCPSMLQKIILKF